MNLQYKEATEADISTIYKLAEEIWNVHYLPIIGQEQINYMLQTLYSEEAQKSQMKNGQIFHLIIVNNNPIGYFSLSKSGSEYMLHKFYILSNEQRKGIGSVVLQNIFSHCKDGSILKLTVNRQNFKSINFYFKHGFIIESVENFDIGNGYFMNDFVMVKNLSTQSWR